jgi:hypothetical protein
VLAILAKICTAFLAAANITFISLQIIERQVTISNIIFLSLALIHRSVVHYVTDSADCGCGLENLEIDEEIINYFFAFVLLFYLYDIFSKRKVV